VASLVGACLIAICPSSSRGAWSAGAGGCLGREAAAGELAFAGVFAVAVAAGDAGLEGSRWLDTLVVTGSAVPVDLDHPRWDVARSGDVEPAGTVVFVGFDTVAVVAEWASDSSMVQVGRDLLQAVEAEMSVVAVHCLVSRAPSLAVLVCPDAVVEVGYPSRDDDGNVNGGGVAVALDHCCVASPHPCGARAGHSQRLPVQVHRE